MNPHNTIKVSIDKLRCVARMHRAREKTGNPFWDCQRCHINCGSDIDYSMIKSYFRRRMADNLMPCSLTT